MSTVTLTPEAIIDAVTAVAKRETVGVRHDRSFVAEVRVAGASDLNNGIVSLTAPNGQRCDMEVIASTEDVATDRMKILSRGWDFQAFLTNPVFLWAHDYTIPPIGTVVDLAVRGGKLIAFVRFNDHTELSRTVAAMYRDGSLRAVSVGLITEKTRTAWDRNLTQAELAEGAEVVSEKTRLLELSSVPVPADAKAIALMVRSGTRSDIMAAIQGLQAQMEALIVRVGTPVVATTPVPAAENIAGQPADQVRSAGTQENTEAKSETDDPSTSAVAEAQRSEESAAPVARTLDVQRLASLVIAVQRATRKPK